MSEVDTFIHQPRVNYFHVLNARGMSEKDDLSVFYKYQVFIVRTEIFETIWLLWHSCSIIFNTNCLEFLALIYIYIYIYLYILFFSPFFFFSIFSSFPFCVHDFIVQFGLVVWVWVMVIFRWLFLFSSTEATLIDEQQ